MGAERPALRIPGIVRTFQRICVFCGSAPGRSERYADAAHALGKDLASKGIELVYGGGQVGLMGILADGVLSAHGRVIGVIPHALARLEVAHKGLTELRKVDTMHERKALMVELSDAFVALPGGYGTLDELCEVLTWQQLGIHDKPIALLDLDGYFRSFLSFLDNALDAGFLRPATRNLLALCEDPKSVVETLSRHNIPDRPRWLQTGQS